MIDASLSDLTWIKRRRDLLPAMGMRSADALDTERAVRRWKLAASFRIVAAE